MIYSFFSTCARCYFVIFISCVFRFQLAFLNRYYRNFKPCLPHLRQTLYQLQLYLYVIQSLGQKAYIENKLVTAWEEHITCFPVTLYWPWSNHPFCYPCYQTSNRHLQFWGFGLVEIDQLPYNVLLYGDIKLSMLTSQQDVCASINEEHHTLWELYYCY